MMSCLNSIMLLTTFLAVMVSEPAFALDQRPTVNDRVKLDEDFPYQGEYLGNLDSNIPRSNTEVVGLQVIAMGDGLFDAVVYSGGLPGSGWNGIKGKLSGERTGDYLDLQGSSYHIIVESGSALVFQLSGGQPLGQLAKVNRASPTLGSLPPVGARVLFNGRGVEHFQNGRMTDDSLLREGVKTKQTYRDYWLHVEFRLPYMPHAKGQARANSGVYLQSRYEVQILDSFGLEGLDHECGGFYKHRKPNVNMCLPPLAWQTYDIEFRAPRFDAEGNKTRHVRISVWHNGVTIHRNVSLTGKTGSGAEEGPNPLPIRLQDHGNPVRFRNIWIVDRNEASPQTIPRITGPPLQSPPLTSPPSQFAPYEYSRDTRVKRAYWLW